MKIDPEFALLCQRLSNLMADLIGRNDEIFLLEPMIRTECRQKGNLRIHFKRAEQYSYRKGCSFQIRHCKSKAEEFYMLHAFLRECLSENVLFSMLDHHTYNRFGGKSKYGLFGNSIQGYFYSNYFTIIKWS